MLIRRESQSEFAAIRNLVETAFLTARVADGDEQDHVERLRAGPNYIPDLALIAEDEGRLIGHIMLTRLAIDTPDGAKPALLLSPLCVVLERRREGVGARLVNEALARAKHHAAVLVLGDPGYYARFGFRPARDFGLRNVDGFPDAHVMARQLRAGGLADLAGTFAFPA